MHASSVTPAADSASPGPTGPTEPKPLAYSVDWLLSRTPYKKTALYEALRRGEIKSTKIGKRIGIPASEIRRLFGEIP